ncbi:MAG: ABC transporter permease [Candidatus Rokuibacteriota bacterium]
MGPYVVRRVLAALPVVLGVMVFSFAMLHLAPGDPAVVIAGADASPEALAAIRAQLELDRPLHAQFLTYLGQLARGDLGHSLVSRKSVADEIRRVFGPTVQLVATALAFALIASLVLGVAAAVWRGSLLDRVATVVGVLGLSLPIFWVGLMLIWWLSFSWALFPISGWGGPIWTLRGLHATTLPALTLGATLIGPLARMIRTTLLEVLRQEYIRTARAKGLGEVRVVYLHALRNAALPVVTIIGLQVGYLLGGAVVTETVFGWPGLGRTAVLAILARDFPLVQGIVITGALTFVVVNLFVDLLYAVFDPRIRY